VTQDADSPGVAMFFPDLLDASELEPRPPNGIVPREPIAHVGVHLLLEMEAHLLVELALDDTAPKEGAKSMEKIAQHRDASKRSR
jgi:hypothetical protein